MIKAAFSRHFLTTFFTSSAGIGVAMSFIKTYREKRRVGWAGKKKKEGEETLHKIRSKNKLNKLPQT